MIDLTITPDIDRAPWTDLTEVIPGKLTRIGLLRNGTEQGRATIALVIQLDDGSHVVAETTWRLFNASARALAVSPVAREETQD